MEYRLDNEPVTINKRYLKRVGIGNTGNVYNYQGQALKIFKSNEKLPFTEESASYLKNIKTSQILLPEKLLFYKDSFKGYTYKLISKKGIGQKIIDLPKKQLIDTIKVLEEDVEILSKYNVLLNGIEPDNTIFNGTLFISDPSRYTILELVNKEELELLNKFQLHLLLTELVSKDLKKDDKLNRKANCVREFMRLKDDSQNSSDFLNDILEEETSVKQFVKRI